MGIIASTLVHTKEGLKPIEQIKVGDLVLSKPESGEGETCYKQVVKTYEYDDRQVYFAAWTIEDPKILRTHPVDRAQLESGFAVVTGGHPFWVKHMTTMDEETFQDIIHEVNDWLSPEMMIKMNRERAKAHGGLGFNFYIELADGRLASLYEYQPILQHRDPEMGIAFTGDPRTWVLCGPAIRFEENGPVAERHKSSGLYLEGMLFREDSIDYDALLSHSFVTTITPPARSPAHRAAVRP